MADACDGGPLLGVPHGLLWLQADLPQGPRGHPLNERAVCAQPHGVRRGEVFWEGLRHLRLPGVWQARCGDDFGAPA